MFPMAEATVVLAEATAVGAPDDISQILGVQEFDVVILVLLLYFIVKFLVDPEQTFRFLIPRDATKPLISYELHMTKIKLDLLNWKLDCLDREIDRLVRKNWKD
jgi:hypothetical protein